MCRASYTLHDAFTRGDVDGFRGVLARGVDINEHDEHDRNLIEHALLEDEYEPARNTRLKLA